MDERRTMKLERAIRYLIDLNRMQADVARHRALVEVHVLTMLKGMGPTPLRGEALRAIHGNTE